MTNYYLNIYQPKDWPIIEIEIRRDPNRMGGCISAKKSINLETAQLAAAVVAPNVSFGGEHTPDDARNIAEWWERAATAAETLDAMILTVEDLKRSITAKMTGKTVFIEFVEAINDPG